MELLDGFALEGKMSYLAPEGVDKFYMTVMPDINKMYLKECFVINVKLD